MAIRESLLDALSSIATSDFVRSVTAAGASSKVTVSNLAKTIIENYTGSTLAGSSQSIKSAIDALDTSVDAISSGTAFTRKQVQTTVTIQGNSSAWISTTPPTGAIAMTGYYVTDWGVAPSVYAMRFGTMAIKNNDSIPTTLSVTMEYLCIE